MPRKPKKPAPQPEAAKSFDEFADDSEGADDDVPPPEMSAAATAAAAEKLRDWRDVERYQEERMLRRLIDDDLDIDSMSEGARVRRRR